MADRIIHPEAYPYRHPPLLEFIQANGLDTHAVPVAFPLVVRDGQLTVTEFVFETLPDGRRRKVLTDGADEVVKRTRTVPLISLPEAHGL